MKKVMLLAALLAMLVVAAVPAIAQVTNDFDQDSDSGEIDQGFTVTDEGSNGNQCASVEGNTNTGNLQGESSFIQYASTIEELEQEEIGSDLTITGTGSTTCTQDVNQAAAAG